MKHNYNLRDCHKLFVPHSNSVLFLITLLLTSDKVWASTSTTTTTRGRYAIAFAPQRSWKRVSTSNPPTGLISTTTRAFTNTIIPSRPEKSFQEILSSSRPETAIYVLKRRKKKSDDETPEEGDDENDSEIGGEEGNNASGRRKIGSRVKEIARALVAKPLSLASNVPMPQAIGAILREASLAAVEQVEDVMQRSLDAHSNPALEESKKLMTKIIDEAFAPMERSLSEMEASLAQARKALEAAKSQSTQAIEAIQVAAIAQAEGAAAAVAQAERVAEREVIAEIYSSANANVNVSELSFEDVDYESSEMAPPFLDSDSCLIPGEPVVRVEKAPENSRRIFAGIDILASKDEVWNVLTNYAELQKVVPNLVVNEVLELYEGKPLNLIRYDKTAPEEVQCKQLAEQMKGALLKQVGGAKVAGINFSAKTTLEVREWPQGLPDFAHYADDMWDGKSREARAKEYPNVRLKRYRFPRPFALSSLPTRDISMQSIENDDGEFRLYQGVWRMQPLVGCAPPGKMAMRLTYAVEISPRAYLPVRLVEGRIAQDLCANLKAIRDAVSSKVPA